MDLAARKDARDARMQAKREAIKGEDQAVDQSEAESVSAAPLREVATKVKDAEVVTKTKTLEKGTEDPSKDAPK